MAQPRKYESAGERQRAWRAAQKTKAVPPARPTPTTPPAIYRRWRATLAQLATQLDAITEEIKDYIPQRSEEWQESQGDVLEEDADQLRSFAEGILDLTLMEKGKQR